jgi:hypothetical protein
VGGPVADRRQQVPFGDELEVAQGHRRAQRPAVEWPWYSVRSERSGPRKAANTRAEATVADIGR